jgi:hypothetical protein
VLKVDEDEARVSGLCAACSSSVGIWFPFAQTWNCFFSKETGSDYSGLLIGLWFKWIRAVESDWFR